MTTEAGKLWKEAHGAFVERFSTESGPGTVHVLVAPLQVGHGGAVLRVVADTLNKKPDARVLLLSWNRVLAEQCSVRLRDMSVSAEVADVRHLRNTLAHFAPGKDTVPTGVFCTTVSILRRPDFLPFLSQVPWDLVVFMEAQDLGPEDLQMASLVRQAAGGPPMLFASQTLVDLSVLAATPTIIDWHPLARSAQEASRSHIRLDTAEYERSQPEQVVEGWVLSLARRLVADLSPAEFLRGIQLLEGAASSIACLEDRLLAVYESLDAGTDLADNFLSLLGLIGQLERDSKLKQVQAHLKEIRDSGASHVVVFTEYRSTLDYLDVGLELDEEEDHLHLISGNDVFIDRAFTQEYFRLKGGVLFITDEGAEGLEFPFAEAVVHYDEPLSEEALNRRVSRYLGLGRETECTVYRLVDASNASEFEFLLHQRASGHLEGDLGEKVSQLLHKPYDEGRALYEEMTRKLDTTDN